MITSRGSATVLIPRPPRQSPRCPHRTLRPRPLPLPRCRPHRTPPAGLRPRPAGALLLVRLLTAAADLAARLGLVRALPGGRQLRHHDLVHERDVGLHVEDIRRQLDRADLLAIGGDDVHSGHSTLPFAGTFAAVRSRTSPPLAPGTAPRTRMRLFSGSTAWTVRFCAV